MGQGTLVIDMQRKPHTLDGQRSFAPDMNIDAYLLRVTAMVKNTFKGADVMIEAAESYGPGTYAYRITFTQTENGKE